ncbi:hypothetical protein TRFO_21984 [Tritrichomonas foetus]|uniref:Uncharacterized protein n=1 Tax=Tritrichomonas foetus TaxID=1144522 RepID=A0A1J4KE10_9EUKA|nr:hypothetical protein TRFO_21984 [Tritrichomonas foetus]|eukprot:OHT09234.1 hypothetical protein TRFO_21984 [Tritrichomonas foetus]
MENIEPPSVHKSSIHWGIHHKHKISFGTSTVYSCFPINRSEFIAIMSTSLVRFEQTIIKETAKLNLSTAIYVPQNNIIIGVSATTSEFIFIRPYDLSHPIYTNVRTKQIPTFHIIYSSQSSILITAGKNIKIWDLKCVLPSRNIISIPPVIEINLRTEINDVHELDLLNDPIFDYKNEYLIIPRSTGFNAYNKDGQFVKQMTKLPTPPRTAATYRTENTCFITVDQLEGVCEWSTNGSLVQRSTIGNTSVISCKLLNDSFLLYLDSKNCLYLYDIRSLRLFLCKQLSEKPISMHVFLDPNPGIAVCIESTIDIYNIVIPWELWTPTMMKPKAISWCPRRDRAARVLVHTYNEYVYFISPKTALPVTSASPSTPIQMIAAYYDRGLSAKEQRDQLFMVLCDGKLVISTTSSNPCEEITTIDARAASVFDCFLENELYYCVVTISGEIIIHDYNTFEPVKRFAVATGNVFFARYEKQQGTILLFYDQEIIRYDIKSSKTVSRYQLVNGSIYDYKDQLTLVGYKNGKIAMIVHDEIEMRNLTNEDAIFHTAEITGFAFGKNFFISVSADQQMKFWSFAGANIMTLLLPLPLYSVEVLNGKRDIIVGTDKEIMIVEGKKIFDEEFEPKDELLDNYNEKNDELSEDGISPLKEQEEQKLAFLSSRKDDEDLKENEGNKSPVFLYKKKEMDEATRKRIYEQMMKMADSSFDASRIAEREKRRFEEQRKRIETDVNKERSALAAEREAKEKEEEALKEKEREEKRKIMLAQMEEEKKARQQKFEDDLAKFKEELQRKEEERKEEERKEKERKEKERKEEEERRRRLEEEEEEENEDDENEEEEIYQKENQQTGKTLLKQPEKKQPGPPRCLQVKPPEKKKSPRGRKKTSQRVKIQQGVINMQFGSKNEAISSKIDKTNNDSNTFNKNIFDGYEAYNLDDENNKGPVCVNGDENKKMIFVSADGKKYTQLENGDWVDEDGNVFHKNADGKFVTEDGKVWEGPTSDGHFESIVNNSFFKEGAKIVTSSGKTLTNIGDGRWVDDEGNVYIMNQKGEFISDDDLPDQWVGTDGTIYYKQADGTYVSADGKVWKGAFDPSKGHFVSNDGAKIGDTFIDENGNVFTRTENGWVDSNGKLYRLNKDGKFVAEDGTIFAGPNSKKRKVIRGDKGYNPKDTYTDENGNVFKRTPSNRGWIGPDGKKYYLNKDGIYVAEDGTIMPLSDEKLCWISKEGVTFRPVGKNNEWISSDGRRFRFDGDKFVADDVTIWDGPSASGGVFAGKEVTDSPLQWVDNDGVVYKPLTKDGKEWINSKGQKFIQQPDGTFLEDQSYRIGNDADEYEYEYSEDEEDKEINKPYKIGDKLKDENGNVYTRIKNGWVDSNGKLYRLTKDGKFVPDDGTHKIKKRVRKQNYYIDENGNKVFKYEPAVWGGPGKSGGHWVNNKGHIIDSLGGYWTDNDNKIYTATKAGYISSDAIMYKPTNKQETFVSQQGDRWCGLGRPNGGKWVESNGDEYVPIDSEGKWEGPGKEIFYPQPSGIWMSENGKKWKGPPFFSARQYFNAKLKYGPGLTFERGKNFFISHYEVMIGKPRSSTPLYRVPPLLYKPFKSRFRPFRPKTPPPKVVRVVYSVPPPNIYVDQEQVIRLLMSGQTQLIPLVKQLGLDKNEMVSTFLSSRDNLPPQAFPQTTPQSIPTGKSTNRRFSPRIPYNPSPKVNSRSTLSPRSQRINENRRVNSSTDYQNDGSHNPPLSSSDNDASTDTEKSSNNQPNDQSNDQSFNEIENNENFNTANKVYRPMITRENEMDAGFFPSGNSPNMNTNVILGKSFPSIRKEIEDFQQEMEESITRRRSQAKEIKHNPVAPIPLLSFVKRDFSSVPMSAQSQMRRMMYSPRMTYLRQRREKAHDTMELNNPLIVRNMTKPKIVIPQTLSRPKRNI